MKKNKVLPSVTTRIEPSGIMLSKDIENRLVVAKKEGVGRRMEWEVGVSRYKLL